MYLKFFRINKLVCAVIPSISFWTKQTLSSYLGEMVEKYLVLIHV